MADLLHATGEILLTWLSCVLLKAALRSVQDRRQLRAPALAHNDDPIGLGAPLISSRFEEDAVAEVRVERRFAAILAADVAGYSRLMGADEAARSRR